MIPPNRQDYWGALRAKAIATSRDIADLTGSSARFKITPSHTDTETRLNRSAVPSLICGWIFWLNRDFDESKLKGRVDQVVRSSVEEDWTRSDRTQEDRSGATATFDRKPLGIEAHGELAGLTVTFSGPLCRELQPLVRCCPHECDVHKGTVVARVRCVSEPRADETRSFATTTGALIELQEWLSSHTVSHVAMEATGVY